jgi:hypothetical protein
MNPTEAFERTRAVIRRQHKAIATEETYHADALSVPSPL